MNYVSPLLQLANAVDFASLENEAAIPDFAGVAWHYGNPLGEQRLLELADTQNPVLVDRSHRHVLAVTGVDATEFLNNLLSQLLLDMTPGQARLGLDLDAQGHILHLMQLVRTDAGFLIDVAATQAPGLLQYLQRMVFWSQVEITSTDLAVLRIYGLDDASLSAAHFSGLQVVAVEDGHAHDVYLPREQLTTFVRESQYRPVGLMAFTAHRVRHMRPELSLDLDAKSIAHEVPAFINRGPHIGAVHLEKGCYRGQETVSRVENLGRAPRQLVLVHLDGSAPELPETGAAITAGKRSVGRLGTVVHDYEYGPIALALVKQSALQQPLQIGDMAIMVDPDSFNVAQPEQKGKQAIAQLKGKA